MTSTAHAQAVARRRAHLAAPPKAINQKSAVGSSHSALETASLLLCVTLLLGGLGYVGVSTSREADRLVQEFSNQLDQAEKAAELEILYRMK